MLNCEEAVDKLWRHLESHGASGGPEAARRSDPELDHHLELCRRCCGESEFAGLLSDLWVSTPPEAIPDDARARLESFVSGLATAGGSDAPGVPEGELRP